MKKTIFRQNDPRWAKLPYPGQGYTIGGSGCGCVAVTHCVIELPKHAKETPATIQPYMKQWAVAGDGTRRVGITAALKHYGFDNVIRHDTMGSLWKECAKGGRVGVLLMGPKRCNDGTRWTTSAHYVAFVDYWKRGNKHCLYIKDSSWRKHDGWIAYEDSFRGNVIEAWSAVIPKAKPLNLTAWYEAMETQYAWSKNQRYKWTTPTIESSRVKGTCITFPAVSLQRLKLLPKGGYIFWSKQDGGLWGSVDYIKKHPRVFEVLYPNKVPSSAKLKKGDICCFERHTMVYMGKDTKGRLRWNTMGEVKRGLNVTYPSADNQRVKAVIRLKRVKP
jgi:hypothetical protein